MRDQVIKVMISLMFLFSASVFAEDNIIHVEHGPDAYEQLQEALILAEPGTTIMVAAGRYDFVDALSLDVSDITVRGAGMDKTIFNFKGQQAGSEGILVTSDRVTLEGFAVVDTPGDGIKIKGVDTVTIRVVRVEWTGGPKASNGAYGLYPVSSKNVLIENSLVIGASDAGIYVGQSQNIVIRHNIAQYNVAGIEIENSYFSDVHNNISQNNTGGILVFDLPGLPQGGGHSTRLFNNIIQNNNTANFAPKGNIVAMVPAGTGVMVMANRGIEVFDNIFDENASAHVIIAAYPRKYYDDAYIPTARRVLLTGNKYGRGGFDPAKMIKTLVGSRTDEVYSDIIWDGAVDGFWSFMFGIDDDDSILVDEAAGTTMVNLNIVHEIYLPWGSSLDQNIENYRGTRARLQAVQLPQDQKQE